MHRFVHPQTFDVGKRNAGETLPNQDRKSTRLNSSHLGISYAVFCLKKKKNTNTVRSLSPPVSSILLAKTSNQQNPSIISSQEITTSARTRKTLTSLS